MASSHYRSPQLCSGLDAPLSYAFVPKEPSCVAATGKSSVHLLPQADGSERIPGPPALKVRSLQGEPDEGFPVASWWFLAHLVEQYFRKVFFHHAYFPPDLGNQLTSCSLNRQGWTSLAAEFLNRARSCSTSLAAALVRGQLQPAELGTQAESHLAACRASGGWIAFRGDTGYPPLLAHVHAPPLLLTGLGARPSYAAAVSVVGARRAHPDSLEAAYALGHDLALAGVTVVSGGAFGVDISSHQGALATGCGQVAALNFMAGGLGHLVPRGNLGIFRHLVQRGGTFLSERFWGDPPQRWDFPRRNRLLVGSVRDVVVVEAAERSGSQVTAQLAVDENRTLWVYDAPQLTSSHYSGSRRLLAEGACSWRTPSQLCQALASGSL